MLGTQMFVLTVSPELYDTMSAQQYSRYISDPLISNALLLTLFDQRRSGTQHILQGCEGGAYSNGVRFWKIILTQNQPQCSLD